MHARLPLYATLVMALGITSASSIERAGDQQATPAFECPAESLLIVVTDPDRRDSTFRITEIPLSRPITTIPEFHDCQRFIVNGQYGQLYAIFAAFKLEDVERRADSAAAVNLEGAVPVATIYSDGEAYFPLGIKPGFNCLFLNKRGRVWTARMVPWGRSDPDCGNRAFDLTMSSTVLEVRIQHSDRFTDADYPAVARWNWDPLHEQQFIEIRCGLAQCLIGRQGFNSGTLFARVPLDFDPLPTALPPLLARQARRAQSSNRVTSINGWNDLQILATVTQGEMRPSYVAALLVPRPELDLINWLSAEEARAYYANQWVHVASAWLDGHYDKWNLRRGLNKIYLCHATDDPASCKPASTSTRLPESKHGLNECPPDPTDGRAWWAMIVSSTGVARYVCVKRMDHWADIEAWRRAHPGQTIRIPGAARWRFLTGDESTWVSCPTGCCTPQ